MPTYFYPFLFALVAVVVAMVLGRRPGLGEADRLASKILYVVAVGCVIVGLATWWLWDHY
jgi:hypothetical protein